ncbi:hypothetical protein SPLC1_S032580 [Arthrospira platensis C1]|nr:hypothetical protein SPLC1_S032580 [Arthrospira platensis C1]
MVSVSDWENEMIRQGFSKPMTRVYHTSINFYIRFVQLFEAGTGV